MTDPFRKGDVFWAPDPYRPGTNPRLWLTLAARDLPYPGEEYICAALTTSDLPKNHAVGDAWVVGRHPERRSFCSPWVVGTVNHDAVADPQGQISTVFTEQMIDQCVDYLRGD